MIAFQFYSTITTVRAARDLPFTDTHSAASMTRELGCWVIAFIATVASTERSFTSVAPGMQRMGLKIEAYQMAKKYQKQHKKMGNVYISSAYANQYPIKLPLAGFNPLHI